MENSQKKKKKKIVFKRTFSRAVFLFPVIKRGEKVSGFVFFRKGRGKILKKLLKKVKKIFLLSGGFLTLFGC